MNKPNESEIFREYPQSLWPHVHARIEDNADKVMVENMLILNQFLEDLKIKNYSGKSRNSLEYCIMKLFRYTKKPYSAKKQRLPKTQSSKSRRY